MALHDAETTRMVRREINRRHIDDSGLHVNAMHGIVYLRGILKPLEGRSIDLKAELDILNRIIRSRPGIRDIVCEVECVKSGLVD
ncbi:MAG: hypothetical protein WCL39_03540 [Armatimonadota bacterium]